MSRSGRHGHRWSRRRTLAAVVIAAAVGLGALAGIYFLGRWMETRDYKEERQQMSEDFGRLHSVQYNGVSYLRRPEVETILIMGVDKRDPEQYNDYRGGGQSDYLVLLALDHKNQQVHQLEIDRNSITDVPIVGVLGNDAGTRRMQISLSHSYGATEKDRCNHTVQALANLLGGETAQHCMSIWLDGISTLNSALGGVTVTIPDDYSHLDPAMVKGAVLKLTDAQAELLVRSRMSMEDTTNASRMIRQRAFTSAVIQEIRERIKQDAGFINTLPSLMEQISSYSDLQQGQVINMLNQAFNYDILPAETLAGEYKVGSDGFSEFHVDEDAVVAWVLKTLYEPHS